MAVGRRIKANRRRWANPVPVLRAAHRLTPEEAEHIRARWEAAIRHRTPVLITPDIEVYR